MRDDSTLHVTVHVNISKVDTPEVLFSGPQVVHYLHVHVCMYMCACTCVLHVHVSMYMCA